MNQNDFYKRMFLKIKREAFIVKKKYPGNESIELDNRFCEDSNLIEMFYELYSE